MTGPSQGQASAQASGQGPGQGQGQGQGRTIFLARRTYRERRMADAARLLPLLGAGLFLLPLLWSGGGTGDGDAADGASTVEVMLYLFLVWIFLAGASVLISRRLPEPQDETRPDGTRPDDIRPDRSG